MMSDRLTQAWPDQRAVWALILEDEAAAAEPPGDPAAAAELGEIAEQLFADLGQARSDAARLRAEVHALAGRPARPSPRRGGLHA